MPPQLPLWLLWPLFVSFLSGFFLVRHSMDPTGVCSGSRHHTAPLRPPSSRLPSPAKSIPAFTHQHLSPPRLPQERIRAGQSTHKVGSDFATENKVRVEKSHAPGRRGDAGEPRLPRRRRGAGEPRLPGRRRNVGEPFRLRWAVGELFIPCWAEQPAGELDGPTSRWAAHGLRMTQTK
ncbi:hypothetical protein Droror1_Dr00005321 [Drosera rotundifolia]